MRDSSVRLVLLSSTVCLVLLAPRAHAEEPILLSNDLSMPTQGLEPAGKKPAAVPMAARPESQVGMAKPKNSPMAAPGAVSHSAFGDPSVDQIEAALSAKTDTAPAAPPTPPLNNQMDNQVPVAPVATPEPEAPTAMPEPSAPLSAPVLRAAPLSQNEINPPTLRVSSERFVPSEMAGKRLQKYPPKYPINNQKVTPQASPMVASAPAPESMKMTAPMPTPVAAAPTLSPASEGIAVEPRPAEPAAQATWEPAPRGENELPDGAAVAPVPVAPEIAVASVPMPTPVAQSPAPKPQVTITGPEVTAEPPAMSATAKTALAPLPIVETFRARKGESIRDVIRRWADRQGIDLVWAMPTEVMLTTDYSYVGKFDAALNGLIAAYPETGLKSTFVQRGPTLDLAAKPYVAESSPPAVPPEPVDGAELADFVPSLPPDAALIEPAAAATQMAAPMAVAPPPPPPSMPPLMPMVAAPPFTPARMSPVVSKGDPSQMPPRLSAANAPAETKPFGPSGRWRALSGASMRQVLEAWAEDAGIPLIWAAQQDFVVRYSVNMRTDYGRAINDMLGQYAFEPVRPTGQVYRDPVSGQNTLVIRSVRG